MQESRLQILQSMAIFGGISETTLNFILDRASIITCRKGDFFFKEGDIDNSIYILEQGRVAVYRLWQGQSYYLRELEAGDCFGEMALMDCKPRSAAVMALEKCSAIKFGAAQLAELYSMDHEQHLLIYMNLGREVCRRLSDADNRLFINQYSLR
jgi:CRP-like cAMP-binding protein